MLHPHPNILNLLLGDNQDYNNAVVILPKTKMQWIEFCFKIVLDFGWTYVLTSMYMGCWLRYAAQTDYK